MLPTQKNCQRAPGPAKAMPSTRTLADRAPLEALLPGPRQTGGAHGPALSPCSSPRTSGYDETSVLRRPPRCSLARPLSLVLSHGTTAQVPSPPTSSFRRIYGLIVQLLPSESVVGDGYTAAS